MKKERILSGSGLLILIVAILLLIPAAVWMLQADRKVSVTIYDKTVPDSSYREHKGLMWLLNQRKIKTAEGGPFQYNRDYYGFLPHEDKTYEIRDLPGELPSTDLLYVTDAYGVYEDEFYGGANVDGSRSRSLYGGLTQKDMDKLRVFASADRPTTLITEFNAFGSPTDPNIRTQLNELLRVRWSGWIGRYIPDLAPGGEVPAWAIAQYEKKNQQKWAYAGPGMLLVNEQDEVVVLEQGPELGPLGNQFVLTEAGGALTGQAAGAGRSYGYWFDITEPMSGAEVLAQYSLDVTESGKQKLAEHGIPSGFPAVMRTGAGNRTQYYFAGDYADNPEVPNYYQYSGLPKLKSWFGFDTSRNGQSFFWKAYVPLMDGILRETEKAKSGVQPASVRQPEENGGVKLVAKTSGLKLQTFQGGQWADLFVKGVNIGAALPGKQFTEFPQDPVLYYRWFESIARMNANTIRIYTLLDPAFYKAFGLYNREHPDKPLWLLQEIWPEENPEGGNYLSSAYMEHYKQEMRHVVDAVHGKADISERKGRAYGVYTSDVSDYVLAYLVGRELEPEEVASTNEQNKGYSFTGDYLFGSSASPTEAWLAESADYVLSYEEKAYAWQHPVAVVNWPTLDPLDHASEWNPEGNKSLEYNDKISVDIRHIKQGARMKAGLFGAYHIYPNYPDFMNNEAKYDAYQDDAGRLRYGGYLQEFMGVHQEYPALVAEFGLATGMGNAHTSPDGYNHGGLTEQQQGDGIVRMMKAIQREHYAGGVIFEWMDEWAKKTWVTEPFMIPYERHALWHNAIDPEQNYGLQAMESVKPAAPAATARSQGYIQQLELRSDVSYLYADITLKEPFDPDRNELLIGLDTYDRTRGERRYLPGLQALSPSGMEYMIRLTGKETGQLLVTPSYNRASLHFSSRPSEMGIFEEMKPLINKARVTQDGKTIPAQYEAASSLKYGELTNSNANWYAQGNQVFVRIPWGRLLVSDPSRGTVIDDDRSFSSDPGRDELRTVRSEGVAVSLLALQKGGQQVLGSLPEQGEGQAPLLPWSGWDYPVYADRLKDSYGTIQRYFETLK